MKNRTPKLSVIPRYPKYQRVVVREKSPGTPVREPNEVLAAYQQVGDIPDRSTSNQFGAPQGFYPNNEC